MSPDTKNKSLLALGMFLLASVIFVSTTAPTLSFWDCGEFIATAASMAVPHPPGASLFLLLGRTFQVLLGFFDDLAFRMNLVSALFAAAAVAVAFLFTEKLISLVMGQKAMNFTSAVGGLVGGLLMAFGDTFWFNAVEFEVYGISQLVIMLDCWLALLWVERRNTPMGQRLLYLICYLSILGVSLQLYGVIALPAIFVLMLMVYPDTRTDYPLWIAGLGMLSVIYAIAWFFFIAAGLIAMFGIGSLLIENAHWKGKWRVAMWFCVMGLLGFSTQFYTPIRASLNPRINENDPKIANVFDLKTWGTFQDYLARKQYGSEGMLERAMHRRGDWMNQLFTHPHMGYGGYMLAQYLPWKVGFGYSKIVDGKYKGKAEFQPDENGPVVRLGHKFRPQVEIMPPYTKRGMQVLLVLLFHVPMLWGAWLAYKTAKPFGVFILLLYGITSAGLIFYMNFSDGIRPDLEPYKMWVREGANVETPPETVYMEVRERDYFFVPAFVFMSCLFGLSAAFLVRKVGEMARGGGLMPQRAVGAVLVMLAFAVPVFSNYHEHDRSKWWVPYDYAKNLLASCEPNSILFTNGDNDTFPLWALQEAYGYRRDVRIINLSLANTDWYVKQLLTTEPKVGFGFNTDEISQLNYQVNRNTAPVDLALGKTGLSITIPGKDKKPYFKVQDVVVVNVVQNNWPARPVHFAVTVSDPNMMGLEKYLVMQGMVYTLTPELKNKALDPVRTAQLVDSVYAYRGLDDPSIWYNNDTKGLLGNYFMNDHQLAMWALQQITPLDADIARLSGDSAKGDSAKAQLARAQAKRDSLFAFGERYVKLSDRILSWDWRHYFYSCGFYIGTKEYPQAVAMLKKGRALGVHEDDFDGRLAEVYTEWGKLDSAILIFERLQAKMPDDFRLAFSLADAYEKQGDLAKARNALAAWVEKNPGHQYAQVFAQRIRELEGRMSPAGAMQGMMGPQMPQMFGGTPPPAPPAPPAKVKPAAKAGKKDS